MTPRKNDLEKSANASGFLKEGSLLAGEVGYALGDGRLRTRGRSTLRNWCIITAFFSQTANDESNVDEDNNDNDVDIANEDEDEEVEDDDDDVEEEKEKKKKKVEDERKFLYFFMPGGRLKSTLASPPSHNGTTQHHERSRPFLWLRY